MDYKLSDKQIRLEIIPVSSYLKKSRDSLYKLPDSSYGEVLILQNGLPKFYYCAFKEDGELGSIARLSKENKQDLEETVLRILENSNHKELSFKQNSSFKIKNEKNATIEEFTVFEIID